MTKVIASSMLCLLIAACGSAPTDESRRFADEQRAERQKRCGHMPERTHKELNAKIACEFPGL